MKPLLTGSRVPLHRGGQVMPAAPAAEAPSLLAQILPQLASSFSGLTTTTEATQLPSLESDSEATAVDLEAEPSVSPRAVAQAPLHELSAHEAGPKVSTSMQGFLVVGLLLCHFLR